LLADQDGLYDSTDYNDRLLLGLRGMMSEAELHILRGRIYQAALNKARRGELITYVPLAYIRTPHGEIAMDPDLEVQDAVKLVFMQYDRLGSAMAFKFATKCGRNVTAEAFRASPFSVCPRNWT